MTRLENLYHSLAAVLTRYHDMQGTNILVKGLDPYVPSKQYFQKAASILKDKGFAAELERLNFECKGQDKDRLALLTYIKDVVHYLHTLNQRTEPFTDSELGKYENLIVQLIIDLKTLLTISKSTPYQATLARIDGDAASIPLKGLLDSGYVSSTLCASGKVIQQEVLSIFGELTDENIRVFSADLCREHSNSILARKFYSDASERLEAEQLAKQTTTQLELAQSQSRSLQEQVALLQKQVATLLEVQEDMKAKVEVGAQAQLDLISVRAAHAELQSQFEGLERKKTETIQCLQNELEAKKLELRLSEGSSSELQLSEGVKREPSPPKFSSFRMPPGAPSPFSPEQRRIPPYTPLFTFQGSGSEGILGIPSTFFGKGAHQALKSKSTPTVSGPSDSPSSNVL